MWASFAFCGVGGLVGRFGGGVGVVLVVFLLLVGFFCLF